jgi:hypothetical protein
MLYFTFVTSMESDKSPLTFIGKRSVLEAKR